MSGPRRGRRRVMRKRVYELGLSALIINRLENALIVYVGDLVQQTEEDLRRFALIDRGRLKEVKEALAQLGLHLGMTVPRWKPTEPGSHAPRPPREIFFGSGGVRFRPSRASRSIS